MSLWDLYLSISHSLLSAEVEPFKNASNTLHKHTHTHTYQHATHTHTHTHTHTLVTYPSTWHAVNTNTHLVTAVAGHIVPL